DSPNYFPNSFDNIKVDAEYKEPAMNLDSLVADWYDRNGANDNDHYTQPGNLYRKVMTDDEKKNTVANIVGAMSGISGPKKDEIINRQLCHFFRADIGLGMAVAQGLGVVVDDKVMEHTKK
ncbi:MAG: catalase, partial [Chitinophagaceae bacterium]|nr:catalase [Chitinophagaceae bacterium]